MKKLCLNKTVALLLLVCMNGVAVCQKRNFGYAANPKLGILGHFDGENSGPIGGAEFYLILNKLTLGLDYFHGRYNWSYGATVIDQVDFMDGMYFDTNSADLRILMQCGIGCFIETTSYQLYGTERIVTIGVPLVVGFKWILSNSLSMGIDLQVNINPENPIYMIMASVEFGKLDHY